MFVEIVIWFCFSVVIMLIVQFCMALKFKKQSTLICLLITVDEYFIRGKLVYNTMMKNCKYTKQHAKFPFSWPWLSTLLA